MSDIPNNVSSGTSTRQGYQDLSGRRSSVNEIEAAMQSNRSAFRPLRYPSQVGQDEQTRHWMLFTIYDTVGANINTQTRVSRSPIDRVAPSNPNTPVSGSIFSRLGTVAGPIGSQVRDQAGRLPELSRGFMTPGINASASSSIESTILSRQSSSLRGKTERVGEVIALYMPDTVGANYTLNYELNDLSFATGAKAFIEALSGYDDKAKIKEIAEQYGLKRGVAKLIDAVGDLVGANPNAMDTIQAALRKTDHPHMEFLFRSVGQREFEFTFNMAPRNESEAQEIRDIIRTFKLYAHPEVTSGGRLQYFPAEFEIGFYVEGKENLYLPRISRVALVGISVNYTPNSRWVAMQDDSVYGSSPSMTQLTLRFAEMEIMHRERIASEF